MDKKSYFLALVRQYFVIYTCSMVATFVFCKIFHSDVCLPVDFLAWMLVFSLCATLPGWLFYSKKELSKKQWMWRKVLHFLLLEVVLLTLGRVGQMYRGIGQAVGFAVTVFCVYAFVMVLEFQSEKKTAVHMNEKLRERRKQLENK